MRQFILFGYLLAKPVSRRRGDAVWTSLEIETDREHGRPRRFCVQLVTDGAELMGEDHRPGDAVFARGDIDASASGGGLELIAEAVTFFDLPR